MLIRIIFEWVVFLSLVFTLEIFRKVVQYSFSEKIFGPLLYIPS